MSKFYRKLEIGGVTVEAASNGKGRWEVAAQGRHLGSIQKHPTVETFVCTTPAVDTEAEMPTLDEAIAAVARANGIE